MIRLDSEDIREIHRIMLERYGGIEGEHEPGLIEFMADKPFQEYFGEELYPGLFLKAAVYRHGFGGVMRSPNLEGCSKQKWTANA